MTLSVRIDPDKLLMEAKAAVVINREEPHIHSMAYSSRYHSIKVPKYTLPERGMESQAAYRLVNDEVSLDRHPELNLGTAVTSWMEPEADKLIMANLNKNFIDVDGNPSCMLLHERCVSMLSNMWNVPANCHAVGSVCNGSSEGVVLSGLALKFAWKQRRVDNLKDYSRPNIVLGSNAHCCVLKFAKYFDVEPRVIDVTQESNYSMDIKQCIKHCDHNTIGVFATLGSTYTGHYDDINMLSDELDELFERTGLDIPIHVDAANGGFVAPFSSPKLSWGFNISRVNSINTSGHKFGLVYSGLGWVVWKDESLLHKDLIFEMHYQGVTEYTYSLNFTRPSTNIIAQYYNFVRLGKEGYSDIVLRCLGNARYLSRALEQSGMFHVVSDIHRKKGHFGIEAGIDRKSYHHSEYNPGLPLVAFTISKKFNELCPGIDVMDISGLLKTKGWLVPTYTLPKGTAESRILRVLIKECMSEEIIDRLLRDIIASCNAINMKGSTDPGAIKPEFSKGGIKSNYVKSVFELMEGDFSENPLNIRQFGDSKHEEGFSTSTNSTFHACC